MGKTYGSGDRVEVNFNGEIHMATVIGLDKDGNILVNGSPRFGNLPMFAGRSVKSSDHEGTIHAAYCFTDEEEKKVEPRPASFTGAVPKAVNDATTKRLGNKEEE